MGSGGRPGFGAWIWVRILILSSALPAALRADPGYRSSPAYVQSGLPDAATAAALLDRFRASVNAEPVYLEFELRAMPRRGPDRVFHGRLWATRDLDGPVDRIELDRPGQPASRLLIRSGSGASVWTADGVLVRPASGAALLSPLLPGTDMTAFDVQMPFLFWSDWRLEDVGRIRGRPAYAFLFTAPAGSAPSLGGNGRVRAFLDAEYNALVESSVLDADGLAVRTVSLLDLKKVAGRWIPKQVDVRDERTRDKTRFTVTAAEIPLSADPAVFDPASLGEAAPIPSDRIQVD